MGFHVPKVWVFVEKPIADRLLSFNFSASLVCKTPKNFKIEWFHVLDSNESPSKRRTRTPLKNRLPNQIRVQLRGQFFFTNLQPELRRKREVPITEVHLVHLLNLLALVIFYTWVVNKIDQNLGICSCHFLG